MSFRVGQTVVHPHHGAAVIDEFEERELNGETAKYVVLSSPDIDLTLKVPLDQCDDIGIRMVMTAAEVDDVLAVLRSEPGPATGHWSRRLKRNQRRLRSGDAHQVAEVLRDLSAKDAEKGLSPAEKRLNDKARRFLCGEMAAVVKGGQEAAETMIAEALGLELTEA